MVNSEDGPTIAEVRRLAGEALRATEFSDKETVLERLATAASELGDPAGAEELYRRVLSLDPENRDAMAALEAERCLAAQA